MRKILFLAVAGALFVSSTAMAQNNYNNCDGSGMGYHRNMTSEQHNQMMKNRAQYHNNGTYHNTRMKQANNNRGSNNYMNHGNHRNNNGYHMNGNNHRNNNGHRGQGRMHSNW
jgi:hypothetical protein